MSLDAVKRVMEVEKQASQQREEGEREARRRITAAEKGRGGAFRKCLSSVGDKSKENDDGRGRKECKRNSRAAGGGCAPV